MRGAPLSAQSINNDALEKDYELIITTSSVDLAILQSIYPRLRHVYSILYFHDNQFEYPKSHQPQSVVDWQMVSLYSAIRADKIVFNTHYNQQSFLCGLRKLLKKMPDLVPKDIADNLTKKATVLPVAISANNLKNHSSERETRKAKSFNVVWNHRWEWDKQPDFLLEVVRQCDLKELPIKFTITGQEFRKKPAAFERLESEYSHCISHMSFVENKSSYRELLQQADIVLSTAIHEFQGIAILEAVDAGCTPLLPNRLSYPELFDKPYLYNSSGSKEQQADSVVKRLKHWLEIGKPPSPNVSRFHESALLEFYVNVISHKPI
jgi:glycosyltransferase involved in cell wall biosynthesis